MLAVKSLRALITTLIIKLHRILFLTVAAAKNNAGDRRRSLSPSISRFRYNRGLHRALPCSRPVPNPAEFPCKRNQ
jgi:hypothetical protein